jgi:hypothetical protein
MGSSFHQRISRLGLLTAALFVLSLILLLPAAWIAVKHWRDYPLPFATTTHIVTGSLVLSAAAAATGASLNCRASCIRCVGMLLTRWGRTRSDSSRVSPKCRRNASTTPPRRRYALPC